MKAIKASIVALTCVAASAFAVSNASAQRFGGARIGGGFGGARIGGFGGFGGPRVGFGGYGRFGGFGGGFGFRNGFWPGVVLGALTGVAFGGWGYGYPYCEDGYGGYAGPYCGYGYGYSYPYYGGYGYPAAYGYGYGYPYPYPTYGYGAPFTGGGFFAEYRGRVTHGRLRGNSRPVAHAGRAPAIRAGFSGSGRR